MKMTSNEHRFTFQNVLDSPYTEQLLEWRNQAFVRENMIDSSIIDEESHSRYLDRLRADDSQKVYIAYYDDRPAAVMTFRFNEDNIESGSYVIHEEDLSKGFGVITGYARFEYIFGKMPQGKMQTVILEHNKKNISLQKNFGCILERVDMVDKTDGTEEAAYVFSMTKDQWILKKPLIERLICRMIPIDNIGAITD